MPSSRKKPVQSSGGSDDEDYRKKRDRNNQAVKRSRVKSKQRTVETQDRVDELRQENDNLERKIAEKKEGVKILKNIFLDTAKAKSEASSTKIDLKKLLEEDDDDDDFGKRSSRNAA